MAVEMPCSEREQTVKSSLPSPNPVHSLQERSALDVTLQPRMSMEREKRKKKDYSITKHRQHY